jgi:hypothetical protein
VSSRSLLSFPPTGVLPGVAGPAVGPVGLGSPPGRSTFGVQTLGTRLHDDGHDSVSASCGCPSCAETLVCSSAALPARSPDHPTRLGSEVFSPGSPIRPFPRSVVALPRSPVTPLMACPALRPRWCPVGFALAHPGLRPSGAGKPSAFPAIPQRDLLADHDDTSVGARSRGLSPCSPSLRTSMTG